MNRTLRVIKISGGLVGGERTARLTSILKASLGRGEQVIVVHGGGPQIQALHDRFELPCESFQGLRCTSEASMPLVTMAVNGAVNTELTAGLVSAGLPAIGLSGVDLGLLRAAFLNQERLGRVGGPPSVDRPRLEALLDAGLLPVIGCVCLAPDGGPINVNADTVAFSIAVSLGADALDFLSDVPGIRTDSGLAQELGRREAEALLASEVIHGGMIPKIQAAITAIEAGVGCVRVGNLETIREGRATEVRA